MAHLIGQGEGIFGCLTSTVRGPFSFWSLPLIGRSEPAALPGNRYVVVVAAKPDVGAVAVAELQRLVLAERDRAGASEARVLLSGKGVFYACNGRGSADPEIAIERGPQPLLKVVTQVCLKGSHGF